MTAEHRRPGTLGRRHFLEGALALGFVAATGRVAGAAPARWSDPRTWTGRVPGPGDIARIDRAVVLDRDARVAGVLIGPRGRLIFDAGRDISLVSSGNIVVEGRLTIRPRRSNIRHVVRFAGVDENRFVGGGHRVLATDVGLWIMHHGHADVRGAPKTPWGRSVDALAPGASSVGLDRDPLGWKRGDEIVIAPTGAPGSGAFETARVQSVDGRIVVFDPPLKHDHPVAGSLGAEVLNMTRNVSIGGRPGGRAHVFVHSAHSQSIAFAELRHVGPRSDRPVSSSAVLGRYGLHFHHSYAGSRGSTVEGVVVRDCGNHSFVPHTSHGITFSNCIAYDVIESPFWWDEGDRTNDTLWTDCVAANVRADNPVAANDLTGFFLGRGTGNAARRCTAVGIGGVTTASGFEWPPEPADGVWTFEDCIAHNNAVHGIFVWQNNNFENVITRFTAYNNGAFGIKHGAFRNAFLYSGLVLVGNAAGGVLLHASSDQTAKGASLSFENSVLEGSGAAPALFLGRHFTNSSTTVRFADCRFPNDGVPAVLVNEAGSSAAGLEDFVRCSVGPADRDLEPSDFQIETMFAGGAMRVQRLDNQSAYRIDRTGAVARIPPFE